LVTKSKIVFAASFGTSLDLIGSVGNSASSYDSISFNILVSPSIYTVTSSHQVSYDINTVSVLLVQRSTVVDRLAKDKE
jgi:hypothetical protein